MTEQEERALIEKLRTLKAELASIKTEMGWQTEKMRAIEADIRICEAKLGLK